jgi:hypothetical protein
MPNAWVTFVKEWSAKHNMRYGCAVSDPQCKKEYHATKTGVIRIKKKQKPISEGTRKMEEANRKARIQNEKTIADIEKMRADEKQSYDSKPHHQKIIHHLANVYNEIIKIVQAYKFAQQASNKGLKKNCRLFETYYDKFYIQPICEYLGITKESSFKLSFTINKEKFKNSEKPYVHDIGLTKYGADDDFVITDYDTVSEWVKNEEKDIEIRRINMFRELAKVGLTIKKEHGYDSFEIVEL